VVRLDGLPVGEIELRPGRGQTLRLAVDEPAGDERAAAIVTVLDGHGLRTSAAPPRVRLAAGQRLEPLELARGRWRVAIPAGTPGARGDEVELIAELEPLPIVVGDALELPSASLPLTLEGLPPAVRATRAADAEAPRADERPGPAAALDAALFGGSTFGALRRGGIALGGELALPVLDERLGVRLGLEFGYGRAEGQVGFDAGPRPASTEITGLVVPLELTGVLLREPGFALRVRGGASLRHEASALTVDGVGAGGGRRWGAGLRLGVEGALTLDRRWQLVLGGLLDGVAASADGFSTETAELSGALTGLRADIGVRAWLSD
jgi:hypothetical protein